MRACIIFISMLVFLFIFLPEVNSSDGCCFDVSTGVCSFNILRENCGIGNIWSSSCSSIPDCDSGCCLFGNYALYSTKRTCEIKARSLGFNFSWSNDVSPQNCRSIIQLKKKGACVFNISSYERSCKFVSREQCNGYFYEGTVCSDPSLKTICKRTEKTKCSEDGNIFFVDSCGNLDVLSKECKYSEGLVCKQNNSRQAFCQSFNCIDKFGNERRNGESWCIGLDGKVLNEDIRKVFIDNPSKKPSGFNELVGSRFFKQSCINGEIITEPCADFRNEVCIPANGTAKCVENPWRDCFDANLDDPSSYDKKKVDLDLCDRDYCYIFEPEKICTSWQIADSNINVNCFLTCNQKNIYLYGRDKFCFFTCNSKYGSPKTITSIDFKGQPCLFVCSKRSSSRSGSDSYYFFNSQDKVPTGKYKDCFFVCDATTSAEERIQWITGQKNPSLICTGYSENEDIKSLNLAMCLPKVSGGLPFYSSGRRENSYCSLGNYERKINFDKSGRLNEADLSSLFRPLSEFSFNSKNQAYNPLFASFIANIFRRLSNSLPIREEVVEILNERCKAIGDCNSKPSWANLSGGKNSNFKKINVASLEKKSASFYYSFQCTPWFASSSEDKCDFCGKDGLPCSEYRCKSLGKKCQYKELRGIDKGVCVRSDDLSPPKISHSQNPNNPIPPFEAVKIILTTDEESYCRFDLSDKKNIEEMRFDTDKNFSKQHEFFIFPPGKKLEDQEDIGYPVLNRDGKFKIFFRCEDGAGNQNIISYLVELDVMKSPDKVPPQILGFFPPSNSFVSFNSKEKKIKINLNEPAECRWDFLDRDYEIMENEFFCDNVDTEKTLVEGYECYANLTEITSEIGNFTKYYIRCKDQPELDENSYNEYYSRNANDRSFEYVLKPSKELLIHDFFPKDKLFIGKNTRNITLQLKTKDGAANGRASCKWRMFFGGSFTAWQNFEKTNSSLHSQTLTNLFEGDYLIQVACTDSAENLALNNFSFYLSKDMEPPKLLRVFNDKGVLKIVLDEKASCKFSNNLSCTFVNDNGTMMNKLSDNIFSAPLRKKTPYFISCEDTFENSFCYSNIFLY